MAVTVTEVSATNVPGSTVRATTLSKVTVAGVGDDVEMVVVVVVPITGPRREG